MTEKLNIRRIDGPMLPQLHPYTSKSDKPQGNTSLVPTITPPKPQSNNPSFIEQYLLVPNPRTIVVRSMHHGRRVCVLVPENENDVIRSLSLVWLPAAKTDDDESDSDHNNIDVNSSAGEWVIVAGCQDGSLQEWAVSSLSLSHSAYCSSISMAETRSVNGRKPRRSFHLTCSHENEGLIKELEVLHLASPESCDDQISNMLADARGGALLFALVKGNDGEETATWLTKCLIPAYANITKRETDSINMSPITSLKFVDTKTSKDNLFKLQTRHVCLKEGDEVFGFLAAYRPNEDSMSTGDSFDIMGGSSSKNSGDVFIVLCSSYGFVVYHEKANASLDEDDEEYLSLVHFTGSTKQHVAHISADSHQFSSVAISPDAKDIVLGRSNGQINLLDDVFDSVVNYLATFKNKMLENEEGNVSEVIEALQHPHSSIVRRTVHWHSHPVVAVSFLAASGSRRAFSPSMTKSLISGGEESVLATWQLERNFHRPTHFLARLSQGAIIHATCCHQSGKIVISCADNSIHCHNAANYDELWVEQGLASMPLHKEDTPNGSIIMMKDPITNIPMFSNLPGAPGMIHWLDPVSNSVVGVLEAAPYNRVSRRDRNNDPHVPVPTVTHMGVGKNGKDLVTVDMVWTENLSVGATHSIAAPNKAIIPMNVCTSIKFWVYRGSSTEGKPERHRKKRNTAMNYELVSSMAAPHGRDGSVCGLDVAPNGNVACSLSQEENAFRVWVKNTASAEVLWKCLYKVKTPSGFSNMLSEKMTPSSSERLVSFSSDGSVLSVCYGSVVTLWDRSNATLLTSLATNDNAVGSQPTEDIQEIYFMNKTDDTMLLTTKTRVYVKSPFGGCGNKCYLGNDQWTLSAGLLGEGKCTLSAVTTLPGFGENRGSGGFFVTAVAVEDGKRSVVSIIDREKGKLLRLNTKNDTPTCWEVDGEVQTLCMSSCRGSSLQLLAITKDCNMVLLSIETDGQDTATREPIRIKKAIETQSSAPLLKFAAEDKEPPVKKRKISIGLNKRSEKKDYSGFDFPALSGRFTRTFIAGKLNSKLHV